MFWIGITLMAIAAFGLWCLCRASARSDERMRLMFYDKFGGPDIDDVNVDEVE